MHKDRDQSYFENPQTFEGLHLDAYSDVVRAQATEIFTAANSANLLLETASPDPSSYETVRNFELAIERHAKAMQQAKIDAIVRKGQVQILAQQLELLKDPSTIPDIDLA